jgi:hypothetical protein
MSKLPNFIIIGAGKCGTTSLHAYLKRHPQIYICPKKETYFFLNEMSRAKHKRYGVTTTLEDYLELFKDAPEGSLIGEISTNYYAYPESAQLIHNLIPDIKIIAILRNPADRAFSSYQMFVQQGHEKRRFQDLVSPDDKHVKRGFYYAELSPFFKVFNRNQIKILFFDDLCKDPDSFTRNLFQYLGVDATALPPMMDRKRQGGLPKNPLLNRLLVKQNPMRSAAAALLKLFIPLELRQKLRMGMIKSNIQKATLDPESRRKLVEIYRDDILKLQDLVERDLSHWLL